MLHDEFHRVQDLLPFQIVIVNFGTKQFVLRARTSFHESLQGTSSPILV